MVWRAEDPQGNEAGKITWELVKYTRGRVLDVGCGRTKAFPHFIGLDSGADISLFGIQVKPDIWIDDATDLRLFASGQYDAVFSSHLLEHIPWEKVPACLAEWWRVLKPGGYLILYLPHEDLYPKVGEPHANPDHKWNVNEARLFEAMDPIQDWDCLRCEQRNEGMEYSLFAVFQKGGTRKHVYQQPRPAKTAAVVRYGAFGDILQASSVFAGLKAQGYHVTVFCSPPGSDVIVHDPNIDELYLQDKDQVPNQQLQLFWDWHKKKYDRWINLSESAEGTLLPIPGRFLHNTTPIARHKLTNHNYLWLQHETAGLPHRPNMKFFATPEEQEWAKNERQKMGNRVLLWPLAGSSVHKVWPYTDTIVARILLEFPDWDVVFTGNEAGVILEQGWFQVGDDGKPVREPDGRKFRVNPRVHCMAGDWKIRETLAFALECDLVCGPETGVLNAVAQERMPKVVFLSHSTVENLTRDWVHTKSLWAKKTECPGRGKNDAPACHQLHYDWSHCRQATDEAGQGMGVAQCQVEITADMAWEVIKPILKGRR